MEWPMGRVAHNNLHEVFSEQDPERRWEAIQRTYAEDVTFIDPEGEVVGRRALSDRAQKFLDGAPADFVFEEDSPRYIATDSAARFSDSLPLAQAVRITCSVAGFNAAITQATLVLGAPAAGTVAIA